MSPTNLSVITIQATQPLASEPGNNPATFTLVRGGDTNSALTVPLRIGGSASNGVDYAAITNSVNLAAGQTSAEILITPIAEPSAKRYKTVILTLPSRRGESPEASGFYVGSLERAVAYIAYNYTNVPPTVDILTPTNGSSFLSLPNIEIVANAFDSNGWVTSVEFVANGKNLGVVSNLSFGGWTAGRPVGHPSRYSFVWTNVAAGDYALTAVATDNARLQTASAAVNIVVTTNLPVPVVRIANPPAGAEFPDLASINLYAAAGETNGVVKTVEFLANGQSLGVATNYLAAEPSSSFHLRAQWVPFYFRWTNAPVGSNVLTAVATDNNGTQAVSAPVSITVSTNAYHFPHGR